MGANKDKIIKQNVPTNRKFVNLIESCITEFDRLTVIEYYGTNNKKHYWLCKCDCGQETIVQTNNLLCGKTKSCGCIRTEKSGNRRKTHGLAKTFEYRCWITMKRRCNNKNDAAYENYGGRGIIVCERWNKNFRNFLEDMGNAPSKKHSIDRINNNGNYCPENCKWSTRLEQSNNKRSNIMLEYDNECLSLMEWSRKTGITYSALQYRFKCGWPIDKMLTTSTKRGVNSNV